MSEMAGLCYLSICTITDVKKRRIYLGPTLAVAGTVMVWVISGRIPLENLAWSVMILISLGIISAMTGEAIGMGDVWMYSICFFLLGGTGGIRLMFYSVVLAAIAGAVKKIKAKQDEITLPLAPFIMVSYIWMILIG